jgi:ABC-type branched-subunit amino acid transport system ATPase component
MSAASISAGEGLRILGLTVRFGGVTAVSGLNLHAPCGQVTGLIGPNGAGKTTTFNACSGLLRPSAGTVQLGGTDVTTQGPARRARLGMRRTFQRMQLFNRMTVRDNLVVAHEALLAGTNPLRQVIGGRADRKQIAVAVDSSLRLCGLEDLAGALAGSLSTGQQRLVDLARACVTGARLLLLDEPSSGLDRAETEQFATILRTLVRERGVGILLVEHDMRLVMDVCQYLYVLDFGLLVFEGTPEQTRASDVVRAAYLGSEQGLSTVAS